MRMSRLSRCVAARCVSPWSPRPRIIPSCSFEMEMSNVPPPSHRRPRCLHCACIKTVSQGGGGRLVHQTQHVEAGDAPAS